MSHNYWTLYKVLTGEFGKGFSERNLRNFRLFYLIVSDMEIWHTRVPNLTWSHFRTLLSVTDTKALRYDSTFIL